MSEEQEVMFDKAQIDLTPPNRHPPYVRKGNRNTLKSKIGKTNQMNSFPVLSKKMRLLNIGMTYQFIFDGNSTSSINSN